MESGKKKLIRDIKYLKFKFSDPYVNLENLLKKGYTKEEIFEEYDNVTPAKEWQGSGFGILFIILAVFLVFNIHSTFGDFNYRFSSGGDFLRFNEWVFKPFSSCLFF